MNKNNSVIQCRIRCWQGVVKNAIWQTFEKVTLHSYRLRKFKVVIGNPVIDVLNDWQERDVHH